MVSESPVQNYTLQWVFERVYLPKEITGNNAGPVTESFGKLARSFLATSLLFAFPHLNKDVSGVRRLIEAFLSSIRRSLPILPLFPALHQPC